MFIFVKHLINKGTKLEERLIIIDTYREEL